MKKLILGCLLVMGLAACEKEDLSAVNSCKNDVVSKFQSYETPSKIKVNFIGSTIGACAGAEIPIVVSGNYTYKQCGNGVTKSFSYSTNPTDLSINRYYSEYEIGCTDQTHCYNYNTLDCSNFVFTVQDEVTGVTVGEVTPACNIKLFQNVGRRTVLKARSTNSAAFYPESGTLEPGNILTCN